MIERIINASDEPRIIISLTHYIDEYMTDYMTLLDYHHNGALESHGLLLLSYINDNQPEPEPITYVSNNLFQLPFSMSCGEYEMVVTPRKLIKAKLTNFIQIKDDQTITFREIPGHFVLTNAKFDDEFSLNTII